MKVKFMRHSGLPVDEENLEKFRERWRSYYDKILGKYNPDMEKVNERLSKLERIMNNHYKTVMDIDFPETAEAWKELTKKYNDSGVLVTTHMETGEILLILMDQGI